jgi:hypothetical protein
MGRSPKILSWGKSQVILTTGQHPPPGKIAFTSFGTVFISWVIQIKDGDAKASVWVAVGVAPI